jgi:hypothetical protein
MNGGCSWKAADESIPSRSTTSDENLDLTNARLDVKRTWGQHFLSRTPGFHLLAAVDSKYCLPATQKNR